MLSSLEVFIKQTQMHGLTKNLILLVRILMYTTVGDKIFKIFP